MNILQFCEKRSLKIITTWISFKRLITFLCFVAVLFSSQKVFAQEVEGTSTPVLVESFNPDSGNAVIELAVPTAVNAIFDHVSTHANDASLVVRVTTMFTNAMFDATAPYHPTAVGIYSRIDRQPENERTLRNLNTALLYACYRVGMNLVPEHAEGWNKMMTIAGLDPDDERMDEETAVGIGNKAAYAIIEARKNDGMNQLGNEEGSRYGTPYEDYTGYEPVNSAYELKDPSRWQPVMKSMGNGIYVIQQFVTPQMGMTEPYAIDDPDNYQTPPPEKSDPSTKGGMDDYKQQADEVLGASANLTDEQKIKAEFFDNKMLGLGAAPVWHAMATEMSMMELIQYDFMVNVAAFDAAIAVWNDKYHYDAVRPFSAIGYIYEDDPVEAWGGPGEGTVTDMPGSRWKSYIPTADHPEYPSASSYLCFATAEASRQYLGSDKLIFEWNYPKGSSRIEPGITPAKDLVLSWDTWTGWEDDCGMSRFWGGMHFKDSILNSKEPAHAIGKKAYEFVQAHIHGKIE